MLFNNLPSYKKMQLKHFFRFLKEYGIYNDYCNGLKRIIDYRTLKYNHKSYNIFDELLYVLPPTQFFNILNHWFYKSFFSKELLKDSIFIETLWCQEMYDSRKPCYENYEIKKAKNILKQRRWWF